MACRVICFASAKGGSGKTSLSATFASLLSQLEKKVLLVDADPATNGLTLLYLKEMRLAAELVHSSGRTPIGLQEALADGCQPDVVTLSERLHLVPASFSLLGPTVVVSESTRQRFRSLLTAVQGSYDYILIDAQAGADDMARVAMSRGVSDEVVIVSEYDPMSAAGVERLKGLLRDDLTYDRTWVLLNKILPEFARSFNDFLEVAKYLSPMPWDAEVVRAYARRKLATDTQTGNAHTLAAIQSLKGLFGDAIKEPLHEWLQTRAAAIRQPIEQQYADVEREMAYLLEKQVLVDRRRQLIRIAGTFAGAIVAMGLLQLIVFKQLGSLTLTRTSTSLAIVTVLGMLAAIFIPALKEFVGRSVKGQIDDARIERQKVILEDRLKRLELLRTLDAENLLRHEDRSSGLRTDGTLHGGR